MGSVSGSLFGPIVGGLLADAFGFQYTFFITSTSVLLAGIIIFFGVKEVRAAVSKKHVKSIHVDKFLVVFLNTAY